jgi:hypothetical protein
MMAEVSKELERLRDLFYGLAELRDRLRGDGATWPWSPPDADAKPLGHCPMADTALSTPPWSSGTWSQRLFTDSCWSSPGGSRGAA